MIIILTKLGVTTVNVFKLTVPGSVVDFNSKVQYFLQEGEMIVKNLNSTALHLSIIKIILDCED